MRINQGQEFVIGGYKVAKVRRVDGQVAGN